MTNNLNTIIEETDRLNLLVEDILTLTKLESKTIILEKEELNKIWDKYYTTTKNHKRTKAGTGIGLSIVKNILELHNFEYGVKTSSKGTNFYFLIKKLNK